MRRTKFNHNGNGNNNDSIPPTIPVHINVNAQEIYFCHEYLTNLDIVEAAIRSRFVKETASAIAKNKVANDLFNREGVKEYLGYIMLQRSARTMITTDMVILELAKIAFFDPIELYDENGFYKKIDEMSVRARACVKKFSVDENGRPNSIELHGKLQALEAILNHNKVAGDTINNLQVNYNTQVNNDNREMRLDLSSFSNEELDVMRKMVGGEVEVDNDGFLLLEQIESDQWQSQHA